MAKCLKHFFPFTLVLTAQQKNRRRKILCDLIGVVRAGQDEDPVGGVRDVLVIEPDSHTVLSRLLKRNVRVEPVLTVRTDGIIKHSENVLTNQERPSATSANFKFF